jgi:hypothetical protein
VYSHLTAGTTVNKVVIASEERKQKVDKDLDGG